jgi:hypothetical protein
MNISDSFHASANHDSSRTYSSQFIQSTFSYVAEAVLSTLKPSGNFTYDQV